MGHALLTDTLNRRFRYPGVDRFARQCKLSRSHLYGIANGNASIGPKAAKRILDAVRAEELALADKIEAELVAHWLHSGELE